MTGEESKSYKYSDENITTVNSNLSDLLVNYFITTRTDTKIIIQFDRLDDNYNQYQDIEEYYQSIISLFKTVYKYFSQELLESILVWKEKRNQFIHALMKQTFTGKEMEAFVMEGQTIIKTLSSKSTSFKRALERQAAQEK